MKVVLVDDSELDVFINKKLLESCGLPLHVNTFTNPHEALSFVRGENDISLLLVDNQMPGLSGYEFIQKVLENPDFTTQILVLTATVRGEDDQKFKALNSNIMLLEKPLDPEAIKAILSSAH